MPYPTEHTCIVREKADFDESTFRTIQRKHEGKSYRVIVGKLKDAAGADDPMVEHSYRYPRDEWTETDARAHCREHDGINFEPAAEAGRAKPQEDSSVASLPQNDISVRAAIGVHHTETTDEGWDGPANEARLKTDESEAYYRQAFAWQDADADPKTKAAYKFIHHQVAEGGDIGAANARGCSAGVAVLNGGRGGADIPDGDRPGVWRHLAAHIEDAGKEAPELSRSAGQIERRTVQRADLRIMAQAGQTRIQGYGALFGVLSEDLGWFLEMIEEGAFAECLSHKPDIRCLWQHDPSYVFGRTVNNTLQISEDERGLWYDCLPPETTWAKDAVETIRRGDVNQSSFAFMSVDERWEKKDGQMVRIITRAEVFDVSPVTYPAYSDTVVGVRAVWQAAGRDPGRMIEMMDRALRAGADIPLPDVKMRQALHGFLTGAERDDREAVRRELEHLERRLKLAEEDI